MKLIGVQHVAVMVTDLEAALAFYCGKLGLERVPSPPQLSSVWLQAGGQQVHLVPRSAVPTRLEANVPHLALEVDDLDAAIAELEGAEVAVTRLPYVSGAGQQAFVYDGDGNPTELNQPDR